VGVSNQRYGCASNMGQSFKNYGDFAAKCSKYDCEIKLEMSVELDDSPVVLLTHEVVVATLDDIASKMFLLADGKMPWRISLSTELFESCS